VVDDARGTFAPVDDSKHRPIEQALVVCKRGPNCAGGQLFADYVNSPSGREVLARYGLAPPAPAATK
jgi:ABC-type molybdate transport system substrate-binding protein